MGPEKAKNNRPEWEPTGTPINVPLAKAAGLAALPTVLSRVNPLAGEDFDMATDTAVFIGFRFANSFDLVLASRLGDRS